MISFFQEQLTLFQKEKTFFTKKSQNFSLWRSLFFLTVLILSIWLANERQAAAFVWVLLISIPIFLILIKKHLEAQKQKRKAEFLIEINQEEIKRLEDNWQDLTENGSKFADSGHFYTADLDFFGKKSLFQYLNRAETFLGKRTLSHYLLQPANPTEIRQRQEALAELKTMNTFRQQTQVFGREEDTQYFTAENLKDLHLWLESPDPLANKNVLRVGVWLLPILFIFVLVLFFIQIVPFWVFLPFYFANSLLFKAVLARTLPAEKQLLPANKLLKTLPNILELIEKQDFKAEKLKSLQKKLQTQNLKAAPKIRSFTFTAEMLEYKANWIFSIFVCVPFVFDWHVWQRLEKYKKAIRLALPQYLEVIGEIEALNSLAAFAFAFPDLPFPQIFDQNAFVLEAEQIGHPLIKTSKRVSNSFIINHLGDSVVLTGSNMSGKSTFLRTLGVNVAMALAGGVVCAEKMSISPCLLFTSMRTQDSLADETSSFYAELKRLKQLIDLLENSQLPVFYLLDEILKGTNSSDRREGTKRLLEKLLARKASGIVATHDLEVAEWALDKSQIRNYSFNSQIKEQEILFDYRLCEGICSGFNADKLMRLMGITE